LRDEIFRTPRHIVLHLLAPLFVAGIQKFLAVASRCAKVRLQDRITAVSKELCERVVAPAVSSPWTTVRNDDCRKILCFHPLWQCEISRDLQTVRGLVTDRFHWCEIITVKLLPDLILQR